MLNLENNSIIEIGSGRGQNLKNMINAKDSITNLTLTAVDLDDFHHLPIDTFIKCNLADPTDRLNLKKNKYDILICTDVFEHLDKSYIEEVIQLCSEISRYSIIAIANHSDVWNGVELHTIQEHDSWWDDLLNKYFLVRDKVINNEKTLYMYTTESKS